MADKESMAKSFKEKELEVFKQVTKDLQDELKREKKLREHYQWRGSKLPPFSIEHLPGERERLGGAGMTAEDRALRKQYFEDQRLAAHEPVAIPELQRRNPIRKLGSIPMQGLESVLKPFVGLKAASSIRWWSAKLGASLVLVWAAWYNLKYQPNNWESTSGWNTAWQKPVILPSDPRYAEEEKLPAKDDFFDLGFKKRTAMRDVSETSFTRPAYYPPTPSMLLGNLYRLEKTQELSESSE